MDVDAHLLSPPENGRYSFTGGRFEIPQLEPREGGGGQGRNAGLRMSWNGEDDHPPPEGLGLVKREPVEPSLASLAGIREEEEERHQRSDLESEQEEEESPQKLYRRGSDSNVVFGNSAMVPHAHHLSSSSTTSSSASSSHNHLHYQHIPPPLTFFPSNSNFSPRNLHSTSEAASQFGASASSSLTSTSSSSSHFPSSSTGTTKSGHFPSSAASTHASSSSSSSSSSAAALAPAFGLSPLLDADSRPSSRGASIDLSHPLPRGAAVSTSSYQLHQHPSFGPSSTLPSHLSQSVGSGTTEHQSTYPAHSLGGGEGLVRHHDDDEHDASRNRNDQHRQKYGREIAISGSHHHHSRQEQIHENGGVVRPGEGPLGASLNGNGNGNEDGAASRPPSPPSLLWGLPQLRPRKRRLASLNQQGRGGAQVDSSPESRSSGGWGGEASSVYSGGRQDAPRSIQRRQSLPYTYSSSEHQQHASSSSSYTFGGGGQHHRSSPLHGYSAHTHAQHRGLPSYRSDTFVPRFESHHEQQQQQQHPHHNPPLSPAHHHPRGFPSTPARYVPLPTTHNATIPDSSSSSSFSYHAPSSHNIHQRYGGRGGMFARPLPLVSPPLHVGLLSPLTCAPELPPSHHDELPQEPSEDSSSLLFGEGGTPSHLRSDSLHRSPSPANLEVHLSLASPFEQDKRTRIYSGPNVTTQVSNLASLPLTSEGSGQSNTSLECVNSTGTRRRSLALSVSHLIGPSGEQRSGSRQSTSVGVMGLVGEDERAGTGGGGLVYA